MSRWSFSSVLSVESENFYESFASKNFQFGFLVKKYVNFSLWKKRRYQKLDNNSNVVAFRYSFSFRLQYYTGDQVEDFLEF
jgi:hypothetical protein